MRPDSSFKAPSRPLVLATPVALLALHVCFIEYGMYGTDGGLLSIIMHIAGGWWVAYAYCYCAYALEFGKDSWGYIVVLIVGITWEVYEVYGMQEFREFMGWAPFQYSTMDALEDIMFAMVGGWMYVSAHVLKKYSLV